MQHRYLIPLTGRLTHPKSHLGQPIHHTPSGMPMLQSARCLLLLQFIPAVHAAYVGLNGDRSTGLAASPRGLSGTVPASAVLGHSPA